MSWLSGLEQEEAVPFHEHLFLHKHLAPFPDGPVRTFMELVVLGLSKNPHLSVDEKLDHINWYAKYFEKQWVYDMVCNFLNSQKIKDGNSINFLCNAWYHLHIRLSFRIDSFTTSTHLLHEMEGETQRLPSLSLLTRLHTNDKRCGSASVPIYSVQQLSSFMQYSSQLYALFRNRSLYCLLVCIGRTQTVYSQL